MELEDCLHSSEPIDARFHRDRRTSLQTAVASDSGSAARNPAYARDGRLAVSVQGDLWIVSKRGEWTRVTSGPGVGSRAGVDGRRIDDRVFVRSRRTTSISGAWRRRAARAASRNESRRLRLPDGQPAVARDGRIFFVRGRLGAATLWVRQRMAAKTRVTKDRAVEQWPSVSADGIAARVRLDRRRHAEAARAHARHGRATASCSPIRASSIRRGRRPAIALSWTATGARGVVYVTPLDGRYINLVSARHAESAWNPDGKTLALADIPPTDAIAPVGYNGDPGSHRRSRGESPRVDERQVVDGRRADAARPAAWPKQSAERDVSDRAQRNADAFDQLWNRNGDALLLERPTRRRAARSGRRSRRSIVRAPSPRRPTTS